MIRDLMRTAILVVIGKQEKRESGMIALTFLVKFHLNRYWIEVIFQELLYIIYIYIIILKLILCLYYSQILSRAIQ